MPPLTGKAGMVLGFALAAVIAMIFMSPIVGAVNENTGTQSVTNESITADVGNFTELQGYDIDSGTVTVYGYNESSSSFETASAGTDYEINLGPGELKALSGSSLIDDGEEVKVTYDYQASGSIATTVVGFIPVMIATLVIFVLGQGLQREM